MCNRGTAVLSLSARIQTFTTSHCIDCELTYADDIQIYLARDSKNFDSSIAEKLKLNPDNAEVMIIENKHTRESLIQKFPVTFLQSSRTPTEKVNLSITFDSENT